MGYKPTVTLVRGETGDLLADFQNPSSSCWLSKSIKLRIHSSVILLVVLCECETWCLTIREGHMLRMFESGMLRRMFGLMKEVVMGTGENYIMWNFMNFIPHQPSFG